MSSEDLDLSNVASADALIAGSATPAKRRGLLPFRSIEFIAGGIDLVLILSISAISGISYHLVFLGQAGHLETFFGIGCLTYVNFSALLAARGSYLPQNLANFRRQVRETTSVWCFVFFVLAVVAFSFKVGDVYSRGATLTFFVSGLITILAWRLIVSRFIAHALAEGAFSERRIILIAETDELHGSDTVEELRRCGYLPARTFDFPTSQLSAEVGSTHLFAPIDEIAAISRREPIEGVFILMSWDNRRTIQQLMDSLRVLSVPVYLLPDRNVAHFLGKRTINIGPALTAELKRAPLTAAEQWSKRLLDIVIASAVLTMLTPMMILVAILIKVESRGPALFRQTRNGFSGRPFKICKFRTMHVVEDGPVIRQATKDDPRVTRLGRLLRRANIDELPQLLNVISGDMSIVGPRPHAAAHNSEYERIIANYAFRYHVRPGLTGWAQINGLRGETKTLDLMAKRVEFDLWYINNWSFWLDFRILVRTLLLGLQPTAY